MGLTFDPTNATNNVNFDVHNIANSECKNIGFLFAQLQMELAQSNKEKALNVIDSIRDSQAKSAKYTNIINILNGIAAGLKDDSTKCKMSDQTAIQALTPEEKELAKAACNVDITSGEPTRVQIQTWVANLQNVQETVGSDVQQQMVYVQDYMGQYNSYTQGSSSAISTANDTLKTVARGG